MIEKTISEFFEKDWFEYSLYVNEARAIPSFVDGLKPVGRFLECAGQKMVKNDWDKTAAVGSSIAKMGYAHGETNAQDSLTKMTSKQFNNVPFFDGDGNFGNKLSPDSAAAPRYTKVRLSKIVDYIFKDDNLCPKHPDSEIVIPKYLLPIIPTILLNGSEGIGHGFATDIPPSSLQSLIDVVKAKLEDKPFIDKLKPQYPMFKGTIKKDSENNQYILTGILNLKTGNKVEITELPYGYTYTSYESILDKLEEKRLIVSYENNSRADEFNFLVQLPRSKRYSEEQLIKLLRLEKTHTWNLTVVNQHGKLKQYANYTDLINDWFEFRKTFFRQRIDEILKKLSLDINFTKSLIAFTNDVITQKFKFLDYKTDELFHKILIDKYKFLDDNVDKVMNRPVRSFTPESLEKLKKNFEELEKEEAYYKSTTIEKEWLKDLKELEDFYKRSVK